MPGQKIIKLIITIKRDDIFTFRRVKQQLEEIEAGKVFLQTYFSEKKSIKISVFASGRRISIVFLLAAFIAFSSKHFPIALCFIDS